jgi:hypothetical protein
VLKEVGGTPVYHPRRRRGAFGHEVRQGAVVKNGVTESVGGIVMMIAGGNAKEVVSRIKARVAEINDKGMLPDGLKIVALLRPLGAGRCGAVDRDQGAARRRRAGRHRALPVPRRRAFVADRRGDAGADAAAHLHGDEPATASRPT